jgi:hypothetical protein
MFFHQQSKVKSSSVFVSIHLQRTLENPHLWLNVCKMIHHVPLCAHVHGSKSMLNLEFVYELSLVLFLVTFNTNKQTSTRVVYLHTLTSPNIAINFREDGRST